MAQLPSSRGGEQEVETKGGHDTAAVIQGEEEQEVEPTWGHDTRATAVIHCKRSGPRASLHDTIEQGLVWPVNGLRPQQQPVLSRR